MFIIEEIWSCPEGRRPHQGYKSSSWVDVTTVSTKFELTESANFIKTISEFKICKKYNSEGVT